MNANTVTSRAATRPLFVLCFSNGVWKHMPHADFFTNMLQEHIRKITGFQKKRIANIGLLAHLKAGDVVHVNGCTFKARYEKDNHETNQPQQAA
jgi:hypothetical protein